MIITIDGCIGSGKSSVLSYLESGAALNTLPEPVGKWQPYLDELYNKVPGSAFRLQTRVWVDRCLTPPPRGVVYMERSPFFQWHCFVNGNLAREGEPVSHLISPLEREVLADMYAQTKRHWQPDVYIYLRCDPQICHRRIQERSGGTENISLSYLEMLHDQHERAARVAQAKGMNVAIIDTSSLPVCDVAQEILDNVQSFEHMIEYSALAIPVPEKTLYDAFQLLEWIANWNREEDEYNPPASLCRSMSDELESLWRTARP